MNNLHITTTNTHVIVKEIFDSVKTVTYKYTVEEFKERLGIDGKTAKERKTRKKAPTEQFERHVFLVHKAILSGKWTTGAPVSNWKSTIEHLIDSWNKLSDEDIKSIRHCEQFASKLSTIATMLQEKGMNNSAGNIMQIRSIIIKRKSVNTNPVNHDVDLVGHIRDNHGYSDHSFLNK